ncbi:MAG: amidohydrolase, partial [Clostridiales bacterium]|nr:amidohydrolase [Clostridiales bacterium]
MPKLDTIIKAVESAREITFAAERYIWRNPETGWKEVKTNKYLAERFEELGYELTYAENTTGFYTYLDTGKPGPCVLVMAELDSVICPSHPESNPETGAVHSCGHNAQCAAILAVAKALKCEEVTKDLCGKIKLMAVPAEELLEIGFRQELREKGIIKYYGGKVEFMYRGYMDDVDVAIMVHTSGGSDKNFRFTKGSNGCMTKNFAFIGKAAHAGGSPQNGINALYAANLAMNAANSLRETFPDNDHIRFHPIIMNGGGAVNVIPERIEMESYVRGATMESFTRENKKLNRALAGAAASMGAKLHITDAPGYMPLINEVNAKAVAAELMVELAGEENCEITEVWNNGCTDMGDVSCVIPSIHPYAYGAVGTGHGNNYYIEDPERACIMSAKFQVAFISELLKDGGA